jgi:hypothetical protein
VKDAWLQGLLSHIHALFLTVVYFPLPLMERDVSVLSLPSGNTITELCA